MHFLYIGWLCLMIAMGMTLYQLHRLILNAIKIRFILKERQKRAHEIWLNHSLLFIDWKSKNPFHTTRSLQYQSYLRVEIIVFTKYLQVKNKQTLADEKYLAQLKSQVETIEWIDPHQE